METLKPILDKTREAYDLAAAKYHELFHYELEQKPYDRAILDLFVSKFPLGALICDAGCGPSAHIGRHLYDRGLEVIGVDVSARCVEIAREENPGMQIRCEDMAAMSFPGLELDGIVCYHSIIHTPKAFIPDIFMEFHRVLKTGGRLLVAVKAGSGEGFQDELLGLKTEIYFSLFTEAEISEYFSKSGFALSFLERRQPYDFEIKNDRIYAIGTRI